MAKRKATRAASRRRSPLFYSLVRRQLAAKLREEKGLTRLAARRAARRLSEAVIDKKADEVRVPVGGAFIDWLVEHGPQILELVMKLLPLVLMFLGPEKAKAGAKAKPAAKPAAKPPRKPRPPWPVDVTA